MTELPMFEAPRERELKRSHAQSPQPRRSQQKRVLVDQRSVDPGEAEPTILDIDREYAESGFDVDFFVTPDSMLNCSACSSLVSPDHVEVHSVRRLEGASDPSDMRAVIALICPVCSARGTAILRFGPEAQPEENEIWQRTKDRRDSDTLPSSATQAEQDASAS